MKRLMVSAAMLTLVIAFVIGCAGSPAVKKGDTVKVEYTGKFENGEVFDSSVGKEPLTVTVGQGQVIRGFDNALLGMKVGDTKTVTIPMEDAYGPYRPELAMTAPRERLPEGMEPQVGMRMQSQAPNGAPVTLTITEVNDSTVTVDANHPLAGKNLVFDLKLVEITNSAEGSGE